ncbi:hypothetical protein Y032_0149g2716 [Ancylostoma ceylanicum]|uniref:Major facilitator superfamily (MFS) profile domain-containing protein n=1 Tax=Ancylostoma ceylanicum TaxID=53326 RepID=A0A016T1K0_9BILA|nr:hypothetical protein Y032_0149g2716 [Ancylostoma ceylanicum]
MVKYQFIQLMLVCLPSVFIAMHVMSWTFAALPAKTKCTNTTENYTCTTVGYSASDRWNIYGSRSWIKGTVQSLYYVGHMIGSFFCGIMSDKIGRKRVLFIAIIIQIICGALLIVAPTWWLFAILKAGTGLSHPGVYAIAIVLGTEVVGAHYRRIVAVGTATAVAIGELILDGMAYLIDDYRILHAAIVGPSLILLSYWWIVPESTRWLVVKERYKEADLILKRAARLNGSAIPERWWEELVTSQVSKHTSAGLIDLFRTPEIRKRTLVCFFVWFVNAMMYYGLTMKSDIGGGDLYINFALSASVEIVGCAFVFFLIDPVGRRIIVAICFLIAGVCLLLNWLIGDNVAFYWGMLQIMITKGAVTASFIAVYTHTAELFPTVIRTTAVGCCSTMSRLGAVISSYMALWLVDNFGKLSMVIPFSTLSFVSAILTAVFLPETVNKPMPETISDVEDKKL